MKPRPDNMFEPTYDGPNSPLRDKLLFIEAMAASGELSLTELRAGIVLIQSFNMHDGAAYPSMEYIAAALGVDERNARRAVRGLETKGWFTCDRTHSGGRSNTNFYVPSPTQVPCAAPFKAAALRTERGVVAPPFSTTCRQAVEEPSVDETEKGGQSDPERGVVAPPDTFLYVSTKRLGYTPSSPDGADAHPQPPTVFNDSKLEPEPTNQPPAEKPPERHYGRWLAAERRRLGLGLADIARPLGMTERQIGEVEAKGHGLSGTARKKVSAFLKEVESRLVAPKPPARAAASPVSNGHDTAKWTADQLRSSAARLGIPVKEPA